MPKVQELMNRGYIESVLRKVHTGECSVEQALSELKHLPFENLGFARLDYHRELRRGFPEAVFCEGKTLEQAATIAAKIRERGQLLLATRASREVYEKIHELVPDAVYYAEGRVVVAGGRHPPEDVNRFILVVCAGTGDIPVLEEARITAEAMGNRVQTLRDVGIAGVHRLLEERDLLLKANVIVVIAGMEGALPGVISGLVECPVIAVPTSIGYGMSLGGVSALLGMLTSCSPGITVVNVDNGFGAGYMASLINNMNCRDGG